MSEILSTWVLKETIKKLDIEKDLQIEIDKFIEKNDAMNQSRLPIAKIMYRCNLHYIIDNIDKIGLINELKEYK